MKSLLVFGAILLTLRVLLLLAALEPAEERVVEIFDTTGIAWAYGPERPLYDREELYAGTAAEAMRRGVPIPYSTYQFMDYGGGSLLTAWAARGVYTLFGPSYLAFKLLGLLITLFGGLFWFATIRRAFGVRIALAFAVLYTLAPSTFVRTLLIAKGDHSEAMAWIGFTLWAAMRATEPGPRRRVWAALSGLAAGFGVFITYSTVPVLAGIFGMALLLTRFRPPGVWGSGAAGFGLGLIPWLGALLATGGGALQVYGRTLGTAASAMGERLSTLVSTGFFAHYDLPGGSPIRQAAGLIFLLAVLTGSVVWIRSVVRTGVLRVRSETSAPTGDSGARSEASERAGVSRARSEASERAGISRAPSETSTPTGISRARGETSTPTGISRARSEASTPTGISRARSEASAPTGDSGADSRANMPTPARADGLWTFPLLALAGTVAHIAAFVLAAPDVASRYLVPVYPLLLLAVACLVTARPLMRVFPGLVALLGALALGITLSQGTWTAARTPLAGTDWPLLGEIVGQKLGPEQIGSLPADLQRHFWVGFGLKVFALTERDEWREGAALAPEAEQGAVWEGVGIALIGSGGAFAEGEYIRSLPAPARESMVRGMARYGEIAFAAIAANRPDIDLGAAEARMAGMPMPDLAESRARSLATLAVHGVEVSNQAWRGIPSALKRRSVGFASFSGAGVGAGAVHRYPIRNDALGQIPENDPDLWTGLGAAFGVEMALTSLSPEERRSRIERASGSAPTPARAHFVEAALNRSSDVTGDLPPTVTP